MNKREFERQLQIDPQRLDDEAARYLTDNDEAKASVKAARRFDNQLESALNIAVPEDLAARVLVNQVYQIEEERVHDDSDRNTRSNSHWRGLLGGSLAAGLFALVFLWQGGYQSTDGFISEQHVVEHIVAHIDEDPNLMTAVNLPTTDAALKQLFRAVGAELDQPLEGMSYAGVCDLEGQKGLHMVMQQPQGPVTVIVMPGQYIAASKAFKASGLHGELIPVKGGMVAIVADTAQQVALAQLRFFQAVRFS